MGSRLKLWIAILESHEKSVCVFFPEFLSFTCRNSLKNYEQNFDMEILHVWKILDMNNSDIGPKTECENE